VVASRVFKLQDRCGLTFREAVAVLSPSSHAGQLAEKWGTTKEAVHNANRRGWDKILSIVGEDDEAINELVPVHFRHVF